MELVTQVHEFIEHPFPFWETNLTQQLVRHKWDELQKQGLNSLIDYNTARVWHKNRAFEMGKKIVVTQNGPNRVYLETPSFDLLQTFYNEHGLEPLTENEMEANAVLLKLKKAISILQCVESAYDCVTSLVRSIQVLPQPDAEIDVSYSHPQIPFSIFVSVCADDSTISNSRVAESILHEAMHLKLTLIEDVVPLVKQDSNNLYYSPFILFALEG